MRMTKEMIERAREMRAEGASYKDIGASLGVSGRAIQYQLNPDQQERRMVYNKEYNATHRTELRAYALVFRKAYCESHKEQTAIYQAAYRAAHKKEAAKYQAAYRARHRAESANYVKEHSAEYAAREGIRRALKAGTLIGATAAQLAEIKEIYRRAKDDGTVRCYLCGEVIPLGKRHVDHVVPLARGGKHRPSNLAVACAACNLRKNAKLPEEVGILL